MHTRLFVIGRLDVTPDSSAVAAPAKLLILALLSIMPISDSWSATFSRVAAGFTIERNCDGFTDHAACLSAFPFVPRVQTTSGDYGDSTTTLMAGGSVSTSSISGSATLLDNSLSLPVLRAAVAAGDDSRPSISVWGAQEYTWLGGATALDFGGTVTYEQSGTCANPQTPGEGCIQARVYAFGSSWDPENDFPFNLPAFGPQFNSGDLLASNVALGSAANVPASFDVSLTFSVQNGDTFFLAGLIDAFSFRGGFADSSSTFQPFVQSADFTEQEISELLVPTAIPVPAAAWLFGSALGLLGWMRRKAA